jgi:lipoate-protein ligase A
MLRRWRLVDSGLVHPPESVALDEAMLEAHSQGRVPATLHFYVRAVPTVSVGYFQKLDESIDVEECRRRGVAIVRRKSGGSTIYTDRGQLIYGLVMDTSCLGRDESVFSAVCGSLARAVSSFGVEAHYRPPNDVEVGGMKVSGSAQLIRSGSVLQHGTVLVDTDLEAMDAVLKPVLQGESLVRPSERVTTLAKVIGRIPDMDAVKGEIAREIELRCDAKFEVASLTDFEARIVQELVVQRYSREDWNSKY